MKEQLQANKMPIAKWIFTGIDLFVVAAVLLLMPKWSFGIFPFYLLMVYFRANLSLMMFRNERKTLWGAVAMALFGLFIIWESSYIFSDIQWHYYGISHALLRYSGFQAVASIGWLALFGWFCFMPLLYCLLLLFYKNRINTAKWSDIFLLTYYKRTDWKRQFVAFFFLSVVVVAAQVVGLESSSNLGSLWAVPLAMVGGWMLTRAFGVEWRKWWVIAGASLLLLGIWASQYLYTEKFIVLLLCYVLGLVLSWIVSKKAVKSLIVGIAVFVVIPLLAFGYNIFAGVEYVRTETFNEQRSKSPWQKRMESFVSSGRGVYYIKDRDGNIGVRDRKKILIPVQYRTILPIPELAECFWVTDNVGKQGVLNLYGGKVMAYKTDEEGKTSVSEMDDRVVVPVEFDTVKYMDNYFIATKRVDGQELFWLYASRGFIAAKSCVSVQIINGAIEAVGLDGEKRILQ